MRSVFALEPTTKVLSDDPYVTAYPYLLEYFSSIKSIEAGDVVRGAHMIYGWMPTILELYPEQGVGGLDAAAFILEKARTNDTLSNKEIESLAALVNNSLVGASKLLHFVAPDKFPIWDSKVYSFIHERRPHHYLVNNVDTYKNFIALLNDLTQKPEFPFFHTSVNKKIGYKVSPIRSLELVMFLNAPIYGG